MIQWGNHCSAPVCSEILVSTVKTIHSGFLLQSLWGYRNVPVLRNKPYIKRSVCNVKCMRFKKCEQCVQLCYRNAREKNIAYDAGQHWVSLSVSADSCSFQSLSHFLIRGLHRYLVLLYTGWWSAICGNKKTPKRIMYCLQIPHCIHGTT